MPDDTPINSFFQKSRKFPAPLMVTSLALVLATVACMTSTPAPTEDPSAGETEVALQASLTSVQADDDRRTSRLAGTATALTQQAIEGATVTAEAAVANTATAEIRQERGTATRQAVVTGTAQAHVTETAQAEALTPLLDTLFADRRPQNIDALNRLLNSAPPQYGPEDGSIQHHPNNQFVEGWDPDIRLEDFILRVEVITPYATTVNPWDFAIFFRSTGANSQFRLTVVSDGLWGLDEWQGGVNRLVQLNSGSVRVSREADVPVTLMTVVRQNRGLFFVNGQYAGLMDVSHKIAPGSLFLGVGSFQGYEKSGYTTHFRNFSVWRVPPPAE